MRADGSRLEWHETDEIDGTTAREFTIHAPDRPITGVLWSSLGCLPGGPLVCFGHGASGDRHQRPIPRIAGQLASAHGCFGLSLDGPVHGRRQIGPGGRASFWPEWRRKGTTEEMVRDWRLALAVISEQPDVGAGPVGRAILLGASCRLDQTTPRPASALQPAGPAPPPGGRASY